jgi:hypothetical protein
MKRVLMSDESIFESTRTDGINPQIRGGEFRKMRKSSNRRPPVARAKICSVGGGQPEKRIQAISLFYMVRVHKSRDNAIVCLPGDLGEPTPRVKRKSKKIIRKEENKKLNSSAGGIACTHTRWRKGGKW